MPASSPAVPPLELRAPAHLLDALTRVLGTAGLGPTTTPEPSCLVLLAHDGAPAPGLADDLVLESRPHLVLGLARDHVAIGPFVDPGLTACLHCLHAAPAPTGLGPLRPDGERRCPPSSLLAVAAAFLAHDVRRWAGGHEPATWSATVRIDATLRVARHEWLRHPQCGCTWSLPA